MNPVELAAELVRIPSVNPMGLRGLGGDFGEAALGSRIAQILGGMGGRVSVADALPSRPNVAAWFDFGAPTTVLFDAHLDTVPADTMTVPPFGGEVREGRLHGRGACDVKGPMAAMLCAIDAARTGSPRHNVLFAAVADEECQFSGVRRLLRDAATLAPQPVTFAVVAEPTLLCPVAAHKGVVRWRAVARGVTAHSSTPRLGRNAVYAMADAVAALRCHAGDLERRAPHPRLGTPTLSVGTIRGGNAVNVVPDFCEVEIDRRLLPGESPDSAGEEMRALLEPFGVELQQAAMQAPAFEAGADSAAVRAALGAARGGGAPAETLAVNYCTDAAFYPAAGIDAVVFGPGSIAQAHTADEWISLEQLYLGVRAYRAIIEGCGQ
jgi:acetylornithine deacetylase